MRPERTSDVSVVEALLLSSQDPLPLDEIGSRLPPGADPRACLAALAEEYEGRAISVVEVAGGWTVRTVPAHSGLCRLLLPKPVKLSRAAYETLAVIAYFQPVTRPEIERVRGVALAKGILDILIFAGLVRPGGRRQAPGSPLTFVTTEAFLRAYALGSIEDLPGISRLREEGLLDASPDIGVRPGEHEGADLTSA